MKHYQLKYPEVHWHATSTQVVDTTVKVNANNNKSIDDPIQFTVTDTAFTVTTGPAAAELNQFVVNKLQSVSINNGTAAWQYSSTDRIVKIEPSGTLPAGLSFEMVGATGFNIKSTPKVTGKFTITVKVNT